MCIRDRSTIASSSSYGGREVKKSGRCACHLTRKVTVITRHRVQFSRKTTENIPIPRDPTDDEALALFKAVEDLFPSQTLEDDKGYILTVSLYMSYLFYALILLACGHRGWRPAWVRTSALQRAHQAAGVYKSKTATSTDAQDQRDSLKAHCHHWCL